MNYNEALDYIHGTMKFGWKLGLHNIRALLELMENPQKKLKFVHVAGTNGKGSTVSFISSILIESGYRVGIYTSPFIQRFTERIRVGSEEISQDDLARLTGYVKEKVDIMLQRGDNHPTEFEIVTAIAFQYYYEKKCDVVVLEVGLGGRFDSTNVIDTPLISVITTISYDHMAQLGNTLPEIAFEKAGIIKKGGDVVLYPQQPEVEEVFNNACLERGSILHKADFNRLFLREANMDGQGFDYRQYEGLRIKLLGEYQTRNAAVAVEAAEMLKAKGLSINESTIRRGLYNARWPGRLEIVHRNPMILVDGAHNAEGARALYDSLNTYFPNKKITFILGVLKDKDYKTVVETVMPLAKGVITVTPASDRALSSEDLAIFLEAYCKNIHVSDTIVNAVRTSLAISTQDDIICAFGSLYFIGEVRDYFVL